MTAPSRSTHAQSKYTPSTHHHRPLLWALLSLTVACSSGATDANSGALARRSGDTAQVWEVGDGSGDTTAGLVDTGLTDAALADSAPSKADADPDAAGRASGGDGSAATALCSHGTVIVQCSYKTEVLSIGFPLDSQRSVHWQLPLGEAPTGGWPWVLIFQGSFFSADQAWTATPLSAFGALYLVETIEALLGAGYAVLTPEAAASGTTFWNTNVMPWRAAWSSSPDAALMKVLFAAVQAGKFGPLDPKRRFAAGASSGGYMTSRMAIAYPGTFRALAIIAAAYATCAGSLCLVPSLPADHPPTLFMHGQLDLVVPQWTAELYKGALDKQGTPTSLISDPLGGHSWPATGAKAILEFFGEHP